MTTERQPKPTIDAVNDAIGALSDLLHSLRAHGKAARAARSSAARAQGRTGKGSRSAMKGSKKTLRKVGARG